jgi:hypothetical protein
MCCHFLSVDFVLYIYFFGFLIIVFLSDFFNARSYCVKYSKVHCNFISLGQSLQREGHVDNFLIPVFCRKLFEDNHPSKSGRHHFFSFVGVSNFHSLVLFTACGNLF